MYVEDVKDGVCSFYTTLYTEYRSDVEGAFCLVDLVVHPQSV